IPSSVATWFAIAKIGAVIAMVHGGFGGKTGNHSDRILNARAPFLDSSGLRLGGVQVHWAGATVVRHVLVGDAARRLVGDDHRRRAALHRQISADAYLTIPLD